MEARLAPRVRVRKDDFGGVCYVPQRDDFFALDKDVFGFINRLHREFSEIPRDVEKAVRVLATLGIVETRGPKVSEKAFSGPGFIGDFQELVTISDPLVVNCFATAFCPLACIYCHADDLMQARRKEEQDEDVNQVIATAASVPALVAVITGGDPVTRPQRAIRLIEGLARDKAIILDTSGAGDMHQLLPTLVKHDVHVRISIDSVSPENDKLRPVNPLFFSGGRSAFAAAAKALDVCIGAGLSVTVQTVVTSRNDQYSSLRDLRDWLLQKKIKNWVLHITIEGGSARVYEKEVRKHKRPLSLMPNRPRIYDTIRQLVMESGELIDIRCTDTGSTPNSVLLVDSKGDLFTEGLAKLGKVKLYDARTARPDTLKKHWAYVDRFGHARRYLNWSPWLFPDASLEDLSVKVTIPVVAEPQPGFVETEAKYEVADIEGMKREIGRLNGVPRPSALQRDEYFDSVGRTLAAHDFVVRLRYTNGDTFIALKGRRFNSAEFDISRIELEFPTVTKDEVRQLLHEKGLMVTWYFEKRREGYVIPGLDVKVELDQIPEIGWYVEFEGPSESIRLAEKVFSSFLGPKERRNYKEIFVAHKLAQHVREADIIGAEF